MTTASKITVTRILLVPVFAVFAIYYGVSVEEGEPKEWLRVWALATFILASASDGLDGWVARRFKQQSRLGATLDPIADKSLLLTAIITLSFVEWGPGGWQIPRWFTALVIFRDCLILGGVAVLHFMNHQVVIQPHWTGKVCTFTQMFALGWVMLRVIPMDPIYPCLVAALFTLWSGYAYFHEGLLQLRDSPWIKPGSHP
ncbi:MAG: CDP-alcohol phosphatidyltransferase family protein [Verrucomicrobiales bacterium]